MQSGYTCQRCLANLKRVGNGQIAIRNIRHGTGLGISNRRHYTPIKPKTAPLPIQQRRRQGTFETGRAGPVNQDPNVPFTATEPVPPNLQPEESELQSKFRLGPNNLFHSFSGSPIPSIRRKAAFMKFHAFCPHPDHRPTRIATSPHDPESRKTASQSVQGPKHVNFECPDCGLPVYCSEDHWMDDYEHHSETCDTLRQANEDEHDMHAGEPFSNDRWPDRQMEEIVPNMTNWDTYLYTREYAAINDERQLRQITRLLTYPMTIGSILHELSPYNIRRGGRLTPEGLKSFSALRYTMHPERDGSDGTIKNARPRAPPVRIFILGARAESSLPRSCWVQLEFLFHRCAMHLIFIGPEAMSGIRASEPIPERTPRNPFGGVVEDRITHDTKITTFTEYYHTMHKAQYFQPFDPYFDCFVLFHPGLGHPASAHEWEETIPLLLETKVPIICTGYTEWDMQRDKAWVEEKMKGEVDILMEAGENIFRSLRWDLNDADPGDLSCGNWGVWAFRGKRYEAQMGDQFFKFV
ncbi:MAG: hypothetical protein LQ352_001807 [Teloschistes flavicans]|nr:MAG: hypothetical protein LQ352_001807 [Teloschistes flavicans]